MPTLPEIGAAYRLAAKANSSALASGDISVPQWYSRQSRLVQGAHTAIYATGYERPLGEPQRVALTSLLGRQQQALDDWRDQLFGVVTSEDVLYARSLLYLVSGAATYGRAVTDRLGMPPLPAYAGDISTRCHIGCRCYWSITRTGDQDFDCQWIMREAEHCENCRRRAEEWNPLRIRAGVIQLHNTSGLYRSIR